jgi:hypothetical protein
MFLSVAFLHFGVACKYVFQFHGLCFDLNVEKERDGIIGRGGNGYS